MRSLAATAARAGREPVPTASVAPDDKNATKQVRFAKKVVTVRFQVPPSTRLFPHVASRNKKRAPAEMPSKEALKVASKIARNRAKRLQSELGTGARLCLPTTQPDVVLDTNRTWVIDSGSCVNLVRKDELTRDEASRIRPVPVDLNT